MADGLNFTLLSSNGYAGPTGVLRDPAIIKHSDGRYFIAYTLRSWTTQSVSFGIASSTDLLDWTFVTEVPAQVMGASYTWAPDWFLGTDGSINLIVSIDAAGAASSFSSYKFTAINQALDWAGFGSGKEGPALFQLDDGRWRMFMDCYTGCGYLYTTSSDLSTWSVTATLPGGLSGLVRHGAVLREEGMSYGRGDRWVRRREQR